MGPDKGRPIAKVPTDHLAQIMLMEEILHQLRLVVHPIIYRVLYISGGCLGFLPSTFFLGQLDSVTQARSNKAS